MSTYIARHGKAVPNHKQSNYIVSAVFDKKRYHQQTGDMWPITWAKDDNLYAGAGDNRNSPLNFWRVSGEPIMDPQNYTGLHHNDWQLDVMNDWPVHPERYIIREPRANRTRGLKPAGVLDIDGTLFMAVQIHNYIGDDITFKRQCNLKGFIVVSRDCGRTWIEDLTPVDFFDGRLASCHFVQFGKGYTGSRDNYVYAHFPAANDGKSYWENGDYILLGRVPLKRKILMNKYDLLVRENWEFYIGIDGNTPLWDKDDSKAIPVFRYNGMTGENHVFYNKGIDRYIMGNYSFTDRNLIPLPYHQYDHPEAGKRSQMTLYEAPEPWGPWSLFYRDDDWGQYGGYQPAFPTKWMYNNGTTMFMVSSGTFDDYNFTVQRLDVKLDEKYR